MLKLDAITRGSVVQQILVVVEKKIIAKELKPGDPFPSENEMVKSLGVSKSSVREAVKMLEAMNVVEIRKGEGTFVCQSSDSDVINPLLFSLLLQQEPSDKIIELRMMFEPAYSKLALENRTLDDLRIIKRTVIEFRDAIKAGTVCIEHDMAFHRAVLEATHNGFVIKIGKVILELFTASMKHGLFDEPKRSLRMHERIYAAIEDRNVDALMEVIAQSVQWWSS